MVSTLPGACSPPPNSKAISFLHHNHELTHLNNEIDCLKMSNLLLHDEVSSLKAKAHSDCEEVTLLNGRLEVQVLQDTLVMIISCEIHLHYLEHHC